MGFFNRLFGKKSKEEIEILSQISTFNEKEKFQEIIDLVDAMPENKRTADIISEQARAYNNLAWALDFQAEGMDYLHKAIELLKSIEKEQAKDKVWNFRIGYSYFFLDDIDNARKHLRAGDFERGEDFLEIISYADDNNIPLELAKVHFYSEHYLYDENEMTELERHIEKHFGEISNVMHEIVSPDIHCDIYIIEPTEERNYYTLVTGGMGAFDMIVPDQFESPLNAELVINLPPDWNINGQDEKDYWPIRWLKILARLPIEQQTFLGWGHTIPTGEKLEGTDFQSLMLIAAEGTLSDEDGSILELSTNKEVAFYYVLPLYEQEMQYKLETGAAELLDKFSEFEIPYPPVLDINRSNVCAEFHPVQNSSLLDNIKWEFNNYVFSGLMPFYDELKKYNEIKGNNLDNFTPFAMMFSPNKLKLMYDVSIEDKEQLHDHEEVTDEKYFEQKSENGLYDVKVVATFTGNSFAALETLFLIHNTLANKYLDKTSFEGLELIGEEEDGTPLLYLLLG